jgi:hypothetical protein
MQYAIIENGVVVNTVVSNSALKANWVQSDTAGIGWLYDGSTFTAPTPVAEPVQRELSKREWRLLFTDAERPPIDRFNAKFETDPLLTEEQRDDVRSGLEDYKAATVVNKDDPATAKVLGLYVMLGLLAANRPAEILA